MCLHILQVFTDWHWCYLCTFIPWEAWFYLFEWIIFEEKKHSPGEVARFEEPGWRPGSCGSKLVLITWCPWCYTKPDRIVENPNLEVPPNKRQEMLQVWKVFRKNLQNPQMKKSHQVCRNGLLPRQQSDHRLRVSPQSYIWYSNPQRFWGSLVVLEGNIGTKIIADDVVGSHLKGETSKRGRRKKFGQQCGVQGMLKIRGDVKKSDTVATLLATKALQEMVTATCSNYRSVVKEGKIWKYVGNYEISKKLHVPGLKYWKNPPTCSLLFFFFFRGQKKAHGFCRDSGMFSNMGFFFLLNDDTHLTKAGGIVCCWWRGIGIVLRFFEVIISVFWLVLGEMYVALRTCMFIFFVGKMSNLTHCLGKISNLIPY